MNYSASQAYGMAQQPTLSGRTLEGRGFAHAASLLREAREHPDDRRKAVDALSYNHNLWTIVQASLSSAKNAVPSDLSANLMSLSLFVDKRTGEALNSPDVSLLDALIVINRDMASAQLSNN